MNNEETRIDNSRRISTAGNITDRALLLIVSENQFGQVIPLKGTTLLGRGNECSRRLQDPLASKEHCAVIFRDREYFIEDKASTNGTWLNRKRVKRPQQLLYGDRIVIGNTILRFFQEERIEKK